MAVLLSLYLLQKKSKSENDKESSYAGIWWIFIFTAAFVLHLIAFSQIPKPETQFTLNYILYILTMSAKSSIRMFTYDFDYEYVRAIADDNLIYGAAVIACFIAACLWTTIMAKNIFFRGVTNGIKILLHAKLPKKKNEYYYIIVGCEKSMRVFLSNLQKNIGDGDITIITGEATSKLTIDCSKELMEEGYTVIKGKADEAALKKAGINNTRRKTRVIAITESDEQNLNVADIITKKIFYAIFSKELKELRQKHKDNYEEKYKEFLNLTIESLTFKPKSNNEYDKLSAEEKSKENEKRIKCPDLKQKIIDNIKNINLEAHIMYSFIERTEHFAFAENAFGKVDFFNPYDLRARDFFGKHPITSCIPDLIDTEKARLKGNYESNSKIFKSPKNEYLIKNVFVGFGKANYQMLKGSVLTGQLLGCDYNAVIYDENANTEDKNSCNDIKEEKISINQAMFKNHSSGLFSGGDETLKGENYKYLDSPKEKYNIRFKKSNVLVKDFYADIINEIKDNDFTAIYIALGEDKLNIETACEVRQCLYGHGITNVKKIRIFVKICEESVFNNDLVINNPNNIPIKIECFGYNKDIFTVDNIVNESLDKFAKTVTNKNHETPWEFLIETERDINRHRAIIIRTKLNLLGFDLINGKGSEKDSDDYKAVYYRNFKDENDAISKIIALSEEIAKNNNKGIESTEEKNERLDLILDYIETEKDNKNLISDTPRNNLARFEHLRWNTFHLIHGWTKKPITTIGADNSERKNKLTKQHACITTFEELVKLRELQAKEKCKKDPAIPYEKALAKSDTIWYDYNDMDEIVIRLKASDKAISKNR